MNLYKDDDAIVFYFPDHGLDVFQSSPVYFGHSIGISKKAKKLGQEIPFFVYTSKAFKRLHPAIVNCIKRSQDKPFCTDSMTYVIMDVAGYQPRKKQVQH